MTVVKMVCSKRVLLAALMLIASLLAGSIGAQRAAAYFGVCDTDPVAVLSNGMTIAVTTAIVDDPRDINSVVYTIHAPQGVTLDHTHSWGRLHRVETVQFSADQAPNTYVVDTVVSTETSGVAVTVTVTLTNRNTDLVVDAHSTSGFDDQDLSVPLFG